MKTEEAKVIRAALEWTRQIILNDRDLQPYEKKLFEVMGKYIASTKIMPPPKIPAPPKLPEEYQDVDFSSEAPTKPSPYSGMEGMEIMKIIDLINEIAEEIKSNQ